MSNKNTIPFYDFGGKGSLVHFAHANGFHPGAYQEFLKPLTSKFKVIGIEHRPFWQEEPRRTDDWEKVGDDLIQFLDSQNAKNIIGIGHSLGAVATMFAATKRPDLFRHLVLIEPVFLPALWVSAFYLFPVKLRKHLNPLIKITLKRQDIWDSREIVYNSYRKKKVFADISDKILRDYISLGLKDTENGKVTLSYSKEWEAHFFGLAPKVWKKLKQLKTPVFGIRAEDSNTLFSKSWTKWQQIKPHHTFLEVKNSGHLLPLEKPIFLGEKIFENLCHISKPER